MHHTVGLNGVKGIIQYSVQFNCMKCSYSFHPYLLFNKDQDSFTFFGFSVDKRGHAIDPVSTDVIKHNIMSPNLRSILRTNKIDMSESCHKWKRYEFFCIIYRNIFFIIVRSS